MFKFDHKSRIEIFLKLTALHSLAVGIALIVMPAKYLGLFGFENTSASFFQIQGGVFHLVMCAAYLTAAKYLEKSLGLIQFVITAKSMAVIFLLAYFIFKEPTWMVMSSAVGDGLMALIIFILFRQYERNLENAQ